jgi:signal transduction histidine kinase
LTTAAKARATEKLGTLGTRVEPATRAGQERFAAYVAHELREPIALQRARVEVALADPHADTATLRAMGARVVASCEQQHGMIKALLELTRDGRDLVRRERIDLAAITNVALRAHDLGGIEGVVALEPARTIGNPDLVARLVANLLSNATRHNVGGGRLEVVTRTAARHAVLSVANTGPRLPAAELVRLFRPFPLSGGEPRPCADGYGLGLAIVQAIADAHDAVVTAHRRPGGGLRIEVSFPPTTSAAHQVCATAFGPSAEGVVIGEPELEAIDHVSGDGAFDEVTGF